MSTNPGLNAEQRIKPTIGTQFCDLQAMQDQVQIGNATLERNRAPRRFSGAGEELWRTIRTATSQQS
jgi:hypothetical protein